MNFVDDFVEDELPTSIQLSNRIFVNSTDTCKNYNMDLKVVKQFQGVPSAKIWGPAQVTEATPIQLSLHDVLNDGGQPMTYLWEITSLDPPNAEELLRAQSKLLVA